LSIPGLGQKLRRIQDDDQEYRQDGDDSYDYQQLEQSETPTFVTHNAILEY
jgi:hypothetical protein